MGVRSARRHTRTVSSQPPLARCSPSGLQLSASTPPAWPVSAPVARPLPACHSRTTPGESERVREGERKSERGPGVVERPLPSNQPPEHRRVEVSES